MTELFSTPALHGQPPEVRRALERLIAESSREGLISQSFMVPLYDEGEEVRVVADEESLDGPEDVTALPALWDNLLTLTLDLEAGVTYRLFGTASCDFHAKSGVSQETLAVRVNDGTDTLHTLYGTSAGDDWYTPITVPFTMEVEMAGTLTLTMDGQLVATSGSNPSVERMRLIAIAVPVYIEGAGR